MQSSRDFDWTHAVLEQGIAEGLIPGAVVSAFELSAQGRAPECFIFAAGQRRLLPGPQPMLVQTIFDWASLTKPLCTAALVFRAIQRGWVSEQTSIVQLLPEAPPSWSGISLGHLLSHSAGFRAWAPLWQNLREKWREKSGERLSEAPLADRKQEFMRLVLQESPEAAPGERTLYSDFSFLILGFALERLHAMSLDRLWEREMPGIGARFRRVLRPGNLKQPVDEACAATEVVEWRGGTLQGEVHDENCWSMGGHAGHAGLFGSMEDLVAVSRRIFDPGFLRRDLRERMLAPVRGPQGPSRTLGWDLPEGPESSAGPTLGVRSGVVGHLGFTGTSLWIDQRTGWGFSVLTGRVHLGRDHLGIRKFRPRIHESLVLDLQLDAF